MAKSFFWVLLGCLLMTSNGYASSLSDPTAPPNSRTHNNTTKRAALPSLQAIIVGGEQPGAILNQRFVAVNQNISGFTLSRLHQDYVVLARAGKQYKIKLDKVSVKRITVQGQ
ncbi:hypothetical protein [Agarivorans sp. Alg241-V36]|uniref:hypothetical protein n=1 Tax=Agarivorans sp. Alg241-V36 TaxID=2305992 RepID=UPI0013D30B16|nr:hypothetical protein [Agarivorans sp. Alg241-V36]